MHFSTYTTASVLAALATAQTFTDCNPMEKKCDNNPAIAKNFESNFKNGEKALKGWQQTARVPSSPRTSRWSSSGSASSGPPTSPTEGRPRVQVHPGA